MRIGLAPLALAVSVASARLFNASALADALACLYLVLATVSVTRDIDVKATEEV